MYLLEVLDGRLDWVSSEADRRAALEGVANALQTRLQTGIWWRGGELALAFFPEDVANRIASAVSLAVETAAASGQPSAEFVRGVLAMAKSERWPTGSAGPTCWPA